LRLGADGVELDVRRTADGELVVHHDAAIPELGPLNRFPRSELPDWVPSLGRALEVCAGASVNVEIKNSPLDPDHDPSEAIAGEVLQVLASSLTSLSQGARKSPSHVVVSSFSPSTVAAFASALAASAGAASPRASSAGAGAAPEGDSSWNARSTRGVQGTGGALSGDEPAGTVSTPTEIAFGLLVSPAFDALDAVEPAAALGCSSFHPYHLQATPKLVERAHDLGLAVVTWTVNDPEAMAAVLGAGVDAVISDDVPGALKAMGRSAGLVRERGPRGQSRP
jgi:glycerophosphoryl diester phosphodiesterase